MHAPLVDRRETLPLRQRSNEDHAVERFVSERGSVASALHASCGPPTQNEYAVMATHGIEFDGSGYRFAGFRHARLIDALHQSRQAGQGCE